MLILSRFSSANSLKFVRGDPKMDCFIRKSYIRHPLFFCFIPMNARYSGFISFVFGLVSTVFSLRYFSQISDTVVRPFMVNVVNRFRPNSMSNEPSKAVSHVPLAVNTNAPIFVRIYASSNIANLSIALISEAGKVSSFRIVMKQLFKPVLSYNILSHLATPSSLVIGDGEQQLPVTAIIPHGELQWHY